MIRRPSDGRHDAITSPDDDRQMYVRRRDDRVEGTSHTDTVDVHTQNYSRQSPGSMLPVLDPASLTTLSKYVYQKLSSHKVKTHNLKPRTFKLHRSSYRAAWQEWQNGISQLGVYQPTSPALARLLTALVTAPITGMVPLSGAGTQIKLIFTLKEGHKVKFKPMRFPRDHETDPNVFFVDDFERHHAEIAAFHLDKVLGFHRVPPTVGRIVNITDAIEWYADRDFKRTIFTSPAGHRCMYGRCSFYCDRAHAVCAQPGQPDQLEGSLSAWLPFDTQLGRISWEYPWRKSYRISKRARWENAPAYCDQIRGVETFSRGRRLLDVIDVAVFDFLMGNQDRHHYHTFEMFGEEAAIVLVDNGRGFGAADRDDVYLLYPVIQCCQIRYSTLLKLVKLESGPRHLSHGMRRSLVADPVNSGPNGQLLTERHLTALDRRVTRILAAVWTCVQTHGADHVVTDDGF